MLLIRDRKDPRNKAGTTSGYRSSPPPGSIPRPSSWRRPSILERRKVRFFPYNSKSVGTAFRRACADADVRDLHFHDLRHEGTSRLFEVGLSIEQVALVTGHKDWKMLRRYTHIRPEALHRLVAARAPYLAENFAAE
jgi:integrase